MRITLSILLLFCTSCTAQTVELSLSNEPVLGGPCEGCELVFEGMPGSIESSSRIAPKDQKGEPLVVRGIVSRRDGSPAVGIIVYAYQTDAGGIYPKSDTRHGALRGWARTDQAGNYSFETIRPGSYPNSNNPQHIHMHVIEPGIGTYYIDDVIFEDDRLLTPEAKRQMGRGRGGSGVTQPVRDEKGVWNVRRDIVLGKGIDG